MSKPCVLVKNRNHYFDREYNSISIIIRSMTSSRLHTDSYTNVYGMQNIFKFFVEQFVCVPFMLYRIGKNLLLVYCE